MKLLAFDTSTEKGFIALYDNENLLFSIELENASSLIPLLEENLKTHHLEIKDLSLISCGIGPGSYTGLRIGAMCAKTFSYALKIPLVGISSLKSFIPDEDGPFIVLIDAKIGGAYFIKGIKKDKTILYTTDPQMCELSSLPLQDVSHIVTPNKSRLEPLLNTTLPWQEKSPNILHIKKLALQEYQKGTFTTDGQLDLLYLRKTQAEIEKEKDYRQ